MGIGFISRNILSKVLGNAKDKAHLNERSSVNKVSIGTPLKFTKEPYYANESPGML